MQRRKEAEKMIYDPITWMSRYLKIVTMDGQLASLSCNLAQLKVHNSLEAQRQAGHPQRAIILKARREGVSTYSEGRLFYEINVRPMRYACICSADLDASNKVFRMAKIFQDNMPTEAQRSTEYSNRKEIVYTAPHMSSFIVQTAGKGMLGRGGLTHYLHLTEFAFWGDAGNQFVGAAQEVPDDKDTIILIESTANGTEGAFHEMYMQAYEDYLKSGNLTNYLPIFLPWYIFPAYQMPSLDFEIGKPHSEGYDQDWLDDEHELTERFGLTPEQLMWRRWAIKNKCKGDLALFRQEYPADVEEAFIASGRRVFSHSCMAKQTVLNGKQVLFEDDLESIRVHRTYDAWTILKEPVAEHQYTMGIDTMVGKLSDRQDVKSERDYHGVVILNRDEREVVAVYRGQCTQDELAQQCLRAAKVYNNAWVAPEIPNGMQVLVRFRDSGYVHLFQRTQTEDRDFVDDTENLGWKTSTTTRPLMVEAFKSFVDEGVRLNSEALLNEMKKFIYDSSGKAIHAPGKHDDLIFAAMIALQVHLHSPFRAIPYLYDTAGDGQRPLETVNLSMAGVCDPGPWATEQEDELFLFTD